MAVEAKPPAHLSRQSKAWWRRVIEDYELAAWQLRTLQAAAEAFDRMAEARARIAADGLTVEDRFGQTRVHPLIAVERDSRTAYMRAMRELALEVDPPDEPRPPRVRGVK